MKEVVLSKITRGAEKDGYEPVAFETQRGEIKARYYKAGHPIAGMIWVGGVGGDFDTPAKGLYPRLSRMLRGEGLSSLRVQFRFPAILDEAVFDVITGISFLQKEGVPRLGLTGHSFGGAVVIQAASETGSARTVITLSTQSHGAEKVRDLPDTCSILLIHGKEDRVLPDYCSVRTYEMAHKPRKLVLLDGNGHMLDESAESAEREIRDWIRSELLY